MEGFCLIRERKVFEVESLDCGTVKLCIFGGSFDPVHQGHVQVATHAREHCGLDRVLFMPCAGSPLKKESPLASADQRCRMIDLALQGLDWAVLDETDLTLPKPSWSWRVAEQMGSRFPGADLYWLMGKDQWDDLEKWGRWGYLAELVTFIVYYRGGVPEPKEGVKAVFIPGDEPASSTIIRESLYQDASLARWLHPDVAEFIRREGLYAPAAAGC